jgi:structural maintenance of chromosome 1
VSLEDKLQQAEQRKLRLTEEMGHLEMRADVVSQLMLRELNLGYEPVRRHERRTGTHQSQTGSGPSRAGADQVHSLPFQCQKLTLTSIKETELNEKLQDTYAKLLSAGADRRESERETRLREVLSSLKRVFPGVHGRVVDLCKPTSRKYETAVTTILGRNLDAIVVEHEKVAIDCIDFMRNQRAGQATFIPLDTIQVRPVQEKYRNFAKGARLAIDCIEYEPAVERAMQHACGSSLICDSIAVAKHICYDRNQEVKGIYAWIHNC